MSFLVLKLCSDIEKHSVFFHARWEIIVRIKQNVRSNGELWSWVRFAKLFVIIVIKGAKVRMVTCRTNFSLSTTFSYPTVFSETWSWYFADFVQLELMIFFQKIEEKCVLGKWMCVCVCTSCIWAHIFLWICILHNVSQLWLTIMGNILIWIQLYIFLSRKQGERK